MLQREKDHGKRILQLNIKEFEGICHDFQRLKYMEKALTGGLEDRSKLPPTESQLVDIAQKTLKDVEAEFDAYVDARQHRFEEAFKCCEVTLEERRREYEETMRKIRTTNCHPSVPPTRCIAVQTDATHKVCSYCGMESRATIFNPRHVTHVLPAQQPRMTKPRPTVCRGLLPVYPMRQLEPVLRRERTDAN